MLKACLGARQPFVGCCLELLTCALSCSPACLQNSCHIKLVGWPSPAFAVVQCAEVACLPAVQLLKLVNVHTVTDLSSIPFASRELMLIKVGWGDLHSLTLRCGLAQPLTLCCGLAQPLLVDEASALNLE